MAGVFIGTIWSVWHYPLLFLSGQYDIDNYAFHILFHLSYHISLTIIIMYFFRKTGGSVLHAMIIHMVSNMMVNAVYPRPFSSSCIQAALLCAVAAVLIAIDMRRKNGVSFRPAARSVKGG